MVNVHSYSFLNSGKRIFRDKFNVMLQSINRMIHSMSEVEDGRMEKDICFVYSSLGMSSLINFPSHYLNKWNLKISINSPPPTFN
jgi:hypothetical protein